MYATKSATARTTPGMTTGASARKASSWWPGRILRLTMYASTAASPAPTHAVRVPSSSVFQIADRVAPCPNVSAKFSSVKFSAVSGWAHARAKAAFARIP